MAGTFIPLTLAPETGAQASSTSAEVGESGAGGKGAFQSLTEALPKTVSPTALQAPPAVVQNPAARPTLELHTDSGQVQRIRLRCSCGQVHEVECLY